MTADDPAAPARILLVARDQETALFAQRELGRRAGFVVRVASGADDALRQAAAGNWDLVITDADVPGFSAAEAVGWLRELDAATPIAVMTARALGDGEDSALRDSADEVLREPLRPGQLIAVATALVRQGRAARLAGDEIVLAIGAHPEDAEIGVGGTLLAHRAAGHQVAILIMTGRAAAGSQPGGRAGEPAAVARIIGADLYLEDLDAVISEGDPTITAIRRVMERVAPTIVYTHSVHDGQEEHRNTHRAALVAARGVGRVYCFQSPSATDEFGPSLFVGIDAHLPRKLEALGASRSCAERGDRAGPDLITSTARGWGGFARARYAEAFEVVRDRAARSGRGRDGGS